VVKKFKGRVVGGSVISVFKLGEWVVWKQNKILCVLCGLISFGGVWDGLCGLCVFKGVRLGIKQFKFSVFSVVKKGRRCGV
jgi:hypothetical protein